jgi:hypothetical protein
MLFAIDVQCQKCGEKFDCLVPRDQSELPVLCLCGGDAVRIISRPNVARRTFVDGKRRFDKLRQQDAVDHAIHEASERGDRESVGKLAVEKEKLK